MTGLVTALAGLVVLAGARRGVDAEAVVDRTSAQAELAELDRLKSRGLMDEASWVAARAEAGRRLLAARRVSRQPVVGKADRVWVLGAIGATALAALGLYVVIGSPGVKDQGFETRVSEWAQNPEGLEPSQIAALMTRAVKENPDNVQALRLLGAARFEAGDPLGAASALRRAVALEPKDGQSWARLGESLVVASEGLVTADAELALRKAVELDPEQLGARYYLGDAALKRGARDEAAQWWGPVIDTLAPSDPRRSDLMQRLNP